MSNVVAPEVRIYLEHMLQASERIRRYSEDMTEPVFLENELVQDGGGTVIAVPPAPTFGAQNAWRSAPSMSSECRQNWSSRSNRR